VPRILIADDDAPSREAYGMSLKLAGHELCEATDGKEAIRLLGERTFDLVVLDLAMPSPDGVLVLQAIRKHPTWRRLPVIVVTALPQGEADRRVAGLGVAAVLVKSRFSRKDLLVHIQHALARPAAA
jgi:CheY-like chemotaxis protein